MTFTENDKLKALAIVHVFETSRPFGDYAACVVLNDGAGVSYGINQFTHRSGSLALVVTKYLKDGGQIGKDILDAVMPVLKKKTTAAINHLAADERFKKALRSAAVTAEMKAAQNVVAFTKYLRPAMQICDQMGFVSPLSLAVVYDSVTHGSWEYLAGRVRQPAKSESRDTHFEKSWITEYVRIRHRWLTEIRRLKVTTYRTKFFLDQIAIGNWDLRLPMTVHGVRLTERMFLKAETSEGSEMIGVTMSEPGATVAGLPQHWPHFARPEPTGFPTSVDTETDGPPTADTSVLNSVTQIAAAGSEPGATVAGLPQHWPRSARPEPTGFPASADSETDEAPTEATSVLDSATEIATSAAQKFDRVDGVIAAVVTRKDAAKSLWTTVAGTLWQAAWGVFGFIVGLPRIVWIVVALIAAALMILYLYRQILLGRIRETDNRQLTTGNRL